MKILIAEDNHFYRLALKGTLTEWGYEVVEATNGASAWKILQSADAPKIAILDWLMPQMNGTDVCRRVRALHQAEPTYLIMLTSMDGKENIVTALDAGADDFVQKPFDRDQLRARLRVGQRIIGLQTGQTVVFALARAVEAKSAYTQGHADRVTHYALELARQWGVAGPDLETLRWGALLHDIGKIRIPDAILDKPGRLSDAELGLIKNHPTFGVEIVKPLGALQHTLPLIEWHHERPDGKGYPHGLVGEQIPLLVRILSVADVYDALASERPYRRAMPHGVCLEIMGRTAAEGGLDADLVERFGTLPLDTFPGMSGRVNFADYRFSQPQQLVQDSA